MTDTARPEQRSRKQNRAASKGAKGSQQGRGNDASKNKQEGWMPGRQIPTLACPHLYTEHDVYGMEYSLWPVWINYSVCLSPSFLHLQISETWKAGQCPWSHSQQLVSSECLSTFFTHKIQNTPATERKINSIPAKTRTVSTPYSIPSTSCVYIYTHIDVTPSIYGLSLQSLLSSFSP